MVQQRGLNGVSFAQLAKAVGLSKPSVFHHFPNKEALAKALVQLCQDKYGAEYGGIIDSDATAPEKLQRIADSFEHGLRADRLCLHACLPRHWLLLPPQPNEAPSQQTGQQT